MYVTVILSGLALLAVLAVLAGVVDGQARSRAWRDVAVNRRANWAERQRQAADQQARDEQYLQLTRMAQDCDCPVCRLLRGREPQS